MGLGRGRVGHLAQHLLCSSSSKGSGLVQGLIRWLGEESQAGLGAGQRPSTGAGVLWFWNQGRK